MAETLTVGSAGLGTRAARMALISVWLLYLVATALAGDFVSLPLGLPVAFVLGLVASLLLTAPGEEALPPLRALFAVFFIVAAGALGLQALVGLDEVWILNFVAYLAALLIARGNVFLGLAASCSLLSLGVVFVMFFEASLVAMLPFVESTVVAAIVGVIWRFALKKIAQRETQSINLAKQAKLATAIAAESAAKSAMQLKEVAAIAASSLDELANVSVMTAPLRLELALAEAAIRDRIRSPGLQQKDLLAAIRAKRMQGVEVVVIGDNETPISESLAKSIAIYLEPHDSGRAVLRVAADSRGSGASLLLEPALEASTAHLQRISFDRDGKVRSRS